MAKTWFDGETNEVRDIDVENGYVSFIDLSHTRIHNCKFYLEINNGDSDETRLEEIVFVKLIKR